MTPERRRLHSSAILADGLDQLRALALPLLVAMVAGGGVSAFVWLAPLGVLVALGLAYVQWQHTAWWVDDDSIRLRRGVFTERVTSVPVDRVQGIDTVRGPAQRLLGAVEVHVQTAGGGARGEIVLKAVAPAVADELRGLARREPSGTTGEPDLLETRPEAVTAPPPPAPAWRLERRPLMLAALTSGSLGVLVPVVAAATQVLDDLVGARMAERLVPDSPREVLLAAVVVVLVAWVLSFLGTVVAFAGFSVTRDGDRLRIARGIVERRESSVPVARVAAIRIVESPLREPFGLAQVRLESAGYAKEAATAQALLPLVRRSEIEEVLRALLPEFAPQGGAAAEPLETPPARAARRYVVRPVAAAAVVPAVLVAVFGTAGLLALALPVAAALFGLATYRTAGWRLDAARLVLRRRGLQRTTLVADASRLPQLFTSASALQRRARLSTLGIAVSSGRRSEVAHVEEATAADVLGRLTRIAVGEARLRPATAPVSASDDAA